MIMSSYKRTRKWKKKSCILILEGSSGDRCRDDQGRLLWLFLSQNSNGRCFPSGHWNSYGFRFNLPTWGLYGYASHLFLISFLVPIKTLTAVILIWVDDDSQEHLLAAGDIEAGGDDAQTKFRIRNLTKKSDAGVTILGGVNLDIPKGVVFGIIGPSGSGKSTLLRSLNRLWEPPPGTVFMDDRDIRNLDVVSLRRKVGMLFQIPALFEG